MQIGIVGLGRMGGDMTRRLLRAGHRCVVYDIHPDAVQALASEGAVGATRLDDFIAKLGTPRGVPRDGCIATEPRGAAICTAGPTARVTSSRW
jgi:6-phosphogluconate dehydrogenase (decarboxylating)